MPVSDLSKPQPLDIHGAAQPSTPAQPTQAAPSSQPPAAPEPDANDEPTEKPVWRKALGFIVSWIAIPALLVLLVHNFIFQAWYVDGQSMEPTLQNGNYLIVSKFDTTLKKLTGQANKLNVRRGDVVIFNPPGYPTDIFFIKRAIGLPGETVSIKNGTVRIINDANPNGFVLNEPYVGNIPLEGDMEVPVPAGSVFVLGDNRHPNASQDSRYLGPIPMKQFIGIASLRLLPVNKLGPLGNPNYNSAAASTSPATTSP